MRPVDADWALNTLSRIGRFLHGAGALRVWANGSHTGPELAFHWWHPAYWIFTVVMFPIAIIACVVSEATIFEMCPAFRCRIPKWVRREPGQWHRV